LLGRGRFRCSRRERKEGEGCKLGKEEVGIYNGQHP